MCYEFEQFESLRREMEKAEALKKQDTAPTPAKPAVPEKDVKEQEPVPA